MTPTEEVYSALNKRGIDIFTCPLHGRKSICSADGYLGINPNLFEDEADRYTDAIHNEGHFTAGAFYYAESPFQIRAQAEYRADKAATLRHIPLAQLKAYMAQGLSVYEIAACFNVTPEFLWRAYTIYRDHLGVDFTAP